jgi:SNF2 family DNA or RNA helicase
MRNARTVLFERVKKLKAGICWLVSGTPIQNRLKDFHNLCSLLGLSVNKKSLDLSLIGDFVLKRTKQEVGIPMPLLSVDKIMVGWKNQSELELSESIHRFIPHAIREEKLMAMMFAKQSCIMSGLLKKNLWLLSELGVLENMKDLNLKEGVRCSSKLDKVVEKIIERKGNGCGKIVFCHFHKEMDEIGRRLCFDGGMAVAMFDGRVGGVKKRQSILNSGVEVLLLQIQTGCEGLNLQENYSEIYFVSPHWNPAVEEQAIARCHRIGQRKPVVVERFVMGDFIEEEKADLEKEPSIMLTMDNYISKVQDEKKKIHI